MALPPDLAALEAEAEDILRETEKLARFNARIVEQRKRLGPLAVEPLVRFHNEKAAELDARTASLRARTMKAMPRPDRPVMMTGWGTAPTAEA